MADDIEEALNHRKSAEAYDRSRLIVDVFFDGKDVTGVASTKDISLGGLYMNTQADDSGGRVAARPHTFPHGRAGGVSMRKWFTAIPAAVLV